MKNKAKLTMSFKDNHQVEFTGYDEKKLEELMVMLNNKFTFLNFELLNGKRVMINKKNLLSIMFEPNND